MGNLTIKHVRAFVLRGGGADYHDQGDGHWIDDHISTPMSKYPEYRQSRRSFGINVLGTLVVEIEASDGTVGFAVTTGGEPAAYIVEKHLARFIEGARVTDIEKIWDQMYQSTLYYGRKGLVINTISGVDLALWDLLGKLRQEPVHQLLGGAVRDELQFYATGARPDLAQKMGFIGGKMPLHHGPSEGEEGLKRSVVVASPADDAPLMRLRAAMYCTRIAEYFRDKGKNVLLLMDSLTRFAQAQREIALAIGEPPATKGYPPSVFAKLPKLVERAGNAEAGGGSITAFYTVLSEGDDQQDPIADSARGVLDGHIVLSRRLAEEGHYPAIDIEASISRVMPSVVTPTHMARAQQFKQLWSRYQQSRDLISVGAYVAGGDRDTDLAIALQPQLVTYLRQGLNDKISMGESEAHLNSIFAPAPGG